MIYKGDAGELLKATNCANLQNADLNLADLQGARNLTQEQLDKACGDIRTLLPDYPKDYEMKPCPKESK